MIEGGEYPLGEMIPPDRLPYVEALWELVLGWLRRVFSRL